MFSIEVHADDDDDIAAELTALRDFQPDLSGAIPAVTAAVQAANRDARRAGLDNRGKPLAPLAASTLADPNRGPGPALAPHEDGSRSVANFLVTAEPIPGGLRIAAGHIAMPWLRHHAAGAGRLPKRDILGIPDSAAADVDRIVIAEADDQLRQALARGRRGGFFGRIGSFFRGKR